MRELSVSDMEIVGGGADWGEVGAGLAAVALGVAVAATPIGWVGTAGAVALSYAGGVAIGDGIISGQAYSDGDE